MARRGENIRKRKDGRWGTLLHENVSPCCAVSAGMPHIYA